VWSRNHQGCSQGGIRRDKHIKPLVNPHPHTIGSKFHHPRGVRVRVRIILGGDGRTISSGDDPVASACTRDACLRIEPPRVARMHQVVTERVVVGSRLGDVELIPGARVQVKGPQGIVHDVVLDANNTSRHVRRIRCARRRSEEVKREGCACMHVRARCT
jgi:hypothetical protein